jgi:hypothetical protein
MTTNIPHQTAKIYQFPIRGRAAVGGLRKAGSAAEMRTLRVPATALGDGWYHEAAIQELAVQTVQRLTEH